MTAHRGRPGSSELHRSFTKSEGGVSPLINPERIYDTLITPSLFALWLSQLVTFAVYPRFVAKRGGRVLPALVLSAGASALAIYGLWVTIQTSSIGSS